MSEAVQFWLDNKMSTGIKIAGIGDQLLVLYRDRYYLVEKGVAHMRGRKPLRFSKSSLPAIWKKALTGEEAFVATETIQPADDNPLVTEKGGERVKKSDFQPPAPVQTEAVQTEPARTPVPLPRTGRLKLLRNTGKPDKTASAQATVVAKCPYCSYENELPPEKVKIGKPFFLECDRCRADFAVRIVQVMIYQAQVAGFRQPNNGS